MRGCSSRNTVQFFDKIDHNHESQLWKFLKNLRDNLLLDIWHIIDCTEKKMHVLQYIFYICLNAWKLLGFPALGDDLHICDLKLSTKLFKLIFLYQRTKSQQFFQIFRIFLCWYGKFCHFTAPFDDFPDYSGFSSKSGESSMYSLFAVNPAVSCKK